MTLVMEPAAPAGHEQPEPNKPTAPPRLAVALTAVGRALIVLGVVVLLFVMFQVWGTNLQESRAQNGLRDDLESRFENAALEPDRLFVPAAPPTTTAPPASDDTTEAATSDNGIADNATASAGVSAPPPDAIDEALALWFPEDGDALAKIEIPSIDVDKVVVGGVAVADLRKGPGHYSETAQPGTAGNAAIAGHRTTYGAPFNRIDELGPGDEIVITSVQGEFVYRVLDPLEAYVDNLDDVREVGSGHIIVHPSDTWVLGDFGDDRLTLTACHPKLSSRERIIVAAVLVDDVVEIPEWALEAEAARLTTNGSGATDRAGDQPDDDESTAALPTETDEPPAGEAPDLDEGLGGEHDAIPPAIGWVTAALALWWAGGRLGRRYASDRLGRLGLRAVGLVPALVCLWFGFELIDRALPAA